MPRRHRAFVPALAAAALALSAGVVAAQPPAPPAAGPAKRDTTWTGALVRHGWIEGGVGWIAAPGHMRRRFEAGQGLAAGLQATPFAAFRLRLGAEYQLLLANGEATYEYLPGKISGGDSATFLVQSKAWTLGLHADAGWRAPLGLWLSAGGGRQYFDGGLGDFSGLIDDGVVLRVPEVAVDGWGWALSLGVSRSLRPMLPWPVGLSVRWRSLRRGDEDLRLWAIRITSLPAEAPSR